MTEIFSLSDLQLQTLINSSAQLQQAENQIAAMRANHNQTVALIFDAVGADPAGNYTINAEHKTLVTEELPQLKKVSKKSRAK